MTDVGPDPDVEGEPEVKSYKVLGPINIKGENYVAGGTVNLTEEEYEAVKASGAPVEGVEPKTPEEVQSAHDEGVEAQKAEIEAREEKEKEKAAKEEERRKEDEEAEA